MTDKNNKRRSPAFQFYADDFLAGTLDMSQSDVGSYIRLLCHQWSRGSIPVETEKQQRLAGGSISVDVLAKFRLYEDGLLRNQRLEDERIKQDQYRDVQRQKGLLSAKIRKSINNGSTAVGTTVIATVQPEYQPEYQPNTQPEVNSPSPSPSPLPFTSPTPTPKDINLENSSNLKDTALTGISRFVKPTKNELLDEAKRIGLPENEAERFEAFYESNGWKVGRNKMKSWKHAMAGWKSRWTENQTKGWTRELIGTSTPDDADF